MTRQLLGMTSYEAVQDTERPRHCIARSRVISFGFAQDFAEIWILCLRLSLLKATPMLDLNLHRSATACVRGKTIPINLFLMTVLLHAAPNAAKSSSAVGNKFHYFYGT